MAIPIAVGSWEALLVAGCVHAVPQTSQEAKRRETGRRPNGPNMQTTTPMATLIPEHIKYIRILSKKILHRVATRFVLIACRHRSPLFAYHTREGTAGRPHTRLYELTATVSKRYSKNIPFLDGRPFLVHGSYAKQ